MHFIRESVVSLVYNRHGCTLYISNAIQCILVLLQSYYLKKESSVRLSVPAAKGEAPTLSHDEDSSLSPPPSPPASAVPPARNKTCTVV